MFIKKMMFVCIIFLFSFQVCAMDFAEFKTHIVGKTGAVVHNYITPLLKDGLDAQIDALRRHMAAHGHFVSKTSITGGNTTMAWNTFFVKQDCTLYSTEDAQRELIRLIWDSRRLVYTKDVPGALSSVCLDGVVAGVTGVAFGNKDAERICVTVGHRDVEMYNRENLIAIRLAALGHAPTVEDFPDADELAIAQRVHLAIPQFVPNSTIRITLNLADGRVKFNTSYPF